jgi:Ala-tRNA(Pro) deacylase
MTTDGTTTGAPATDLAALTRRIVDLLDANGVAHRLLRHPPVLTSEEASRVRGTPLEAGAKALVCHADDQIVLIVVPADARLDNRAFRQQAGVKNVRMIDAERVQELVGAPVGAVPPFGSLFGLTTYADQEVVERDLIAFNVGARDVSVTMAGPDYAALERPTVGRFARRAETSSQVLPSPAHGIEGADGRLNGAGGGGSDG